MVWPIDAFRAYLQSLCGHGDSIYALSLGAASLTYRKPETRYKSDGTTVSENEEEEEEEAAVPLVTAARLPQLYSASEDLTVRIWTQQLSTSTDPTPPPSVPPTPPPELSEPRPIPPQVQMPTALAFSSKPQRGTRSARRHFRAGTVLTSTSTHFWTIFARFFSSMLPRTRRATHPY